MSFRPSPVLIAIGCVGLVTGASLADAPDPSGSVVPTALKKLIWSKACALPDQSYDVDCAANTDPTKCRFVRSDGEKFEPLAAEYGRTYATARGAGSYTVLEPALREAKILGDQADDGDFAALLFKLVSGLQLSVAPPDDYLVHLNPIAVAWIQRELLPAADEPMCGVTAAEVYTASFQRTVRASALAYEHLKKSGQLAKVDRERLQRERGERQGGYWRVCDALEKGPLHKDFPERMLRDECQFWLRRGASSAAPELATLLGTILERFDPVFFKAHAKTFAPPPAKRGGR